jgi:prevent-host-death family protein
MHTFNIHEAKTHFSQLINQVLMGEEVIIARGNQPVVRLIPYDKKDTSPRKGGQLKDLIRIAPDFDEPLTSDLVKLFYEEDK